MPWVKMSVFIACLIPLGQLAFQAYTDNLGANPVETITRSTGIWTLTFLLITLSVTPLRKVTGWYGFIKLRRMLGLFAFFYVSLHFTTFMVFDHFFDFQEIVKDVAKRPFIAVGFTSFLLLVPLALTSTSGMVRRLGKNWQRLHRLIYVAAVGGVIHFFWLVKADLRRPLIYGSVLALLLLYRITVTWQVKPSIRSFKLSSLRAE